MGTKQTKPNLSHLPPITMGLDELKKGYAVEDKTTEVLGV